MATLRRARSVLECPKQPQLSAAIPRVNQLPLIAGVKGECVMTTTCQQPTTAIACAVEQWLLDAIDRSETLRPAHETKIRNTLDLLRATRSDPGLVRRFESHSCTLAQLDLYRRQGRVNAYASALRRLQRQVRAA
jgi:hypothetical protein